jgi:SnoaL-like domain
MAVDDARTLEQRLRLIEDRFEIYNLIASHPPSADTGAGDYTASVWTEDGVFDRGAEFPRPAGLRSPVGLRTPSTSGRSSRGSRILPGCPMCGSPATRRSRFPTCRSSCPTALVRYSMFPIMAHRVASTCIASRPIAGSSSAPTRAGRSSAGLYARWTARSPRARF